MARTRTTWVKGQGGKPKGAVSEKTKFWEALKDFIINEGSEKFKDEMEKLEGKDFINTYINVLEYFKPKLQRSDSNFTINSDELQEVRRKFIAQIHADRETERGS